MKILLMLVLVLLVFPGPRKSNSERMPAEVKLPVVKQKIMVIDTGLKVNKFNRKYLCKVGHKSFVYGQRALTDSHGHGSNVAGLIMKGMNPDTQCLIIVKFWKENMRGSAMEIVRMALLYALEVRPDFINMSLGGLHFDHSEMANLHKLLKVGTKIAVAAGNENMDLNKNCGYFPACYKLYGKNFRVVGSTQKGIRKLTRTVRLKPKKDIEIKNINGKWYEIYPYTNYGKRVTHWENGTNQGNPQMTGTSQSTAISMSKWIQE